MLNYIKDIKLENFRNYKRKKFSDFGEFNILVGPNAVGKTNVIEAIQLMTELSSFRHPRLSDIILKGAEWSRIEANTEEDNLSLFIDNKKTYKLNYKNKNYKGLYPSVTFTPDDLIMVKGGNSLKRDAIDSLGGQLSKNYYTVRKDYSKALRQKNKLLKETISNKTLQSINDVLVVTGAQLICYRHELLKKVEPILADFYKKITGSNEELSIAYEPSFVIDTYERDTVRDNFKNSLEANILDEQNKRKSIIGPHADRIKFMLNEEDAQTFASQGQQRSIALAFKLTELQLIENILNKTPILLLDDVMSELDASRRKMLIEFVKDKTQVFVTTTNLDYFEKEALEKANIIELCHK